MKIQIIGFAGSGKSTLANKLGELYNIPVLHLDNTKYFGDWEERSIEEQTVLVQDFLNKNSNWVIDGNYSKVCPERFENTDMTIYLKFNRFICFRSAYKRYRKNRFQTTDSCPCKDKFDWWFAKWILFKGRTHQRKIGHIKDLNKTNGKKYIFKNRKQVNKFFEKLQNEVKNKLK